MSRYILAIDQGTSSTKSIIFDQEGQPVAQGSVALQTHYLEHGLVEQNPDAIYNNVLASVQVCLQDFVQQRLPLSGLTACGISNQRETFLLWDQQGKALTPAVVWACKRSIAICQRLKEQQQEDLVRAKTGLILDPYFSATKLLWLLEHDAGLRRKLTAGEVYFGTVDTWLLFKFTRGAHFKTDYTNAQRTMLFNLHSLDWDQELLTSWGLEQLHLPQVGPSAGAFGVIADWSVFGVDQVLHPLPITAMIGDSHAATFGEGCFQSGMAKVTLGTGSSIMLNTGPQPVYSHHGLLTTICWSTPDRVDYALEGAIVACGSIIEWLKNALHLFMDAGETAGMAEAVPDTAGVYLIPAFSGLGAPHWQMDRRAALTGMTFGTTRNHIVRAALESIPYQIKDVIAAMQNDSGGELTALAVNGGLTRNHFILHFLVDLIGVPLYKQSVQDVSALGAAYLAGLYSGVYPSLDQITTLNQRRTTIIHPHNDRTQVLESYSRWRQHIHSNEGFLAL